MKKALIAIASIILLLPVLASCSFTTGTMYANGDAYSVGNAEFSENIEKIEIDWTSGKVNILPASSDKISIEEKTSRDVSENEQMHYLLDGKTLKIKFVKSGTPLISAVTKELNVYIPENSSVKELDVGTASATVNAEVTGVDSASFSTASGDVGAVLDGAKEIDLDTASGRIEIICKGDVNKFEANSASGALQLTADHITDADIETASGKIECVFGKTPDKLDVDTASGRVLLTLPETAGFTADIDTASGSFNCEFATVRNGNSYVCENGASKISVSTASGDIDFLKAD